MRISILTPDISSNGLGRAYILAKVLQRHYSVEIIGPMFGENIWYPLRDDKSMNYKYIKVKNFFNIYNLKQLLKQITGDIIYASKPLMPSFGTGLLKKLTSKMPLILDIDDWELGISKEFYAKLSFTGKFKNFISSFRNCFCYKNIFLFEKLIPLADEITVANSFLQNRFGGILVPHGRDADLLNPENFDRDILRDNL